MSPWCPVLDPVLWAGFLLLARCLSLMPAAHTAAPGKEQVETFITSLFFLINREERNVTYEQIYSIFSVSPNPSVLKKQNHVNINDTEVCLNVGF